MRPVERRYPVGAELAAEEEHVDHLPGRLGSPVALVDLLPELIEAGGPATPLALLAQRERALERARLALQQLEVVVEPGGGLVAAVQTRMAGDRAALMADHELALSLITI